MRRPYCVCGLVDVGGIADGDLQTFPNLPPVVGFFSQRMESTLGAQRQDDPEGVLIANLPFGYKNLIDFPPLALKGTYHY